MSNTIITRVFEQSSTKSGDRLLMVCIADQAGDDGIAWPGLMNLCKRMGGVTKRSVQLQLKRLLPTHEILIYPRTRQSHYYIIAVGMPTKELKQSIRKLAKLRKVSALELAKIRRINAGKRVGVMKKDHQVADEKDSSGVAKKDRQGDESRFTRVMNPDSSGWIDGEYKDDPRSLNNPKMILPPAADAARGAADSPDSTAPDRDEITQVVIVGSFKQSAAADLDEHGEYLLSRITNWLGVNFPDDTAETVRSFYRWYAEKTKGEYAAPRELRKFSMQYREYKAAQDGTAPTPVSSTPALRLTLRSDDPRLAAMTPEQRAQIQIIEAPMTPEERRASAEQMQRMLYGEA